MLRTLAELKGRITGESVTGTTWKQIERRMQEIRHVFRTYFAISSSDPVPFLFHTKYETRFKISCAPSYLEGEAISDTTQST
jgi:hypothetical protein